MAKWEYMVTVLREATLAEKQNTLNEFGALGWELVAVTNTVREWEGQIAAQNEQASSVELRATQRPVMAYFKRRSSR